MINITFPPDKNNLPAAALAYAARGLSLFPLRPRGKTPLTPHGLKDASTDPAAITAWWRQWPEANIGIVAGNGAFWVLDIDGADGERTLSVLEKKHGALPQTVEVITGGGGRHLYFQYPQGGEIFNSAGRLGLCLDVRGNGGYIVAPPSIHGSGRRYEFSVDSHDQIMPAPEWLLKLIQKPAQSSNSNTQKDWLELLKTGVAEGSRNEAIARLTGKLLHHRLDAQISLFLISAFNDSKCRPPLPNDELVKTFLSIAAIEAQKRGAL